MSTSVVSTSKLPGFGQGFIADKEKWLPALRQLQETITFMVAEERITGDDGMSYLVPSFGITGMRLATIPIFGFDRPELIPILGDTMSTDMAHIYIYLPFLQEMVDEWHAEGTYGLSTTLVHETHHMLMNHGPRGEVMREAFTGIECNIAMDNEIDIPIYDDFHHRYPLGTWTLKNTPAYRDGKPREELRGLSFEEMCKLVSDELAERRKQQMQQMMNALGQAGQKGQPGDAGEPADPGQSGSPDDEVEKDQGKSDPDDNSPKDGKDDQAKPSPDEGEIPSEGDEPKMSDIKNVNDIVKELTRLSESLGDKSLMESMVRAGMIQQADMDNIRNAVNEGKDLPDNVKQGLKQITDTSRSQSRQAIQSAKEINERLGGKMPGAHSLQALVTRIRADEEMDIDFESVLSKRVKAIGEHKETDVNKMNGLCYLRHSDIGLKKRMPYLPGKSMAKETVRVGALLDTSGSMSENRDLPDALGALMKLSKQRNAEIYIYSADTVIRSYPTLLTPDLIEQVQREGAEVLGRGGTNLENGLFEIFSRNQADDIRNAIDISHGTSGRKGRSRSGGLSSSSLGGSGLGNKQSDHEYDLIVYLSDFEDSAPRISEFTPDQVKNTILLATSRVPQQNIRLFKDAGWTAYGIGKDKRINLDLNMKVTKP